MSFIDDNTAEYMLYCSTSIVDAAMLLSATPSAVRGAQLLKASMCALHLALKPPVITPRQNASARVGEVG